MDQALAAQLGIDLTKIDWQKWLALLKLLLNFFQGQVLPTKEVFKAALRESGCPDDHLEEACRCCEAACLALRSAELSLTCCQDRCTGSAGRTA